MVTATNQTCFRESPQAAERRRPRAGEEKGDSVSAHPGGVRRSVPAGSTSRARVGETAGLMRGASRSRDRPSTPPVGPVLLVTPWYKPTVGGVAEVAERLRRELTQARIETHLLVCDGDSPRRSVQSASQREKVWRFQIHTGAFHHLSFRSVAGMLTWGSVGFLRLLRFVRTHRVRTIVLLYPGAYAWCFLLLRRCGAVRLIVSCHGNDITRRQRRSVPARWVLRQLLQSADAITVCADHLGRLVRGLFPGRRVPVRYIPNGVDTDHFVLPPPTFIRSDPRRTIVHVSNFAPKKRTVDIIDSFANPVIAPDVRLVMVGAGKTFDETVQRARTLGVHHRVEFVGPVGDVRPYLWGGDLFVLASEDEGAPLVLLEAMACGVPWVSTPWGAAAVLPRGECGFVVPSRSPRKLAHAIAKLLDDPDRRRKMGLRARRRAERDFAEETYVQKHLVLLEEVERGLG
jgi:glycosyltransferase involved in cell wall biosynthesis